MPLQNPANYMLQLPDPAEASRKNLELGMGLVGAQQSIQQAQQRNQIIGLQIEEQQRQQTERQTLQARLAALAQNPNPKEIAAITMEHPELTDGLWKSYQAMDADSQKAQLSVAQKMHFASQSGNPQYAVKTALAEAEASENGGDKKRGAELRVLAKQLKENPGRVDTLIGAFISRAKGMDDYLKTFGNVATNQKAAADATTAMEQAKYAGRTAAAGASKAESDAALSGTNASVAQQYGGLQAAAGLGQTYAQTAQARAGTANTMDQIQNRAAELDIKREELGLSREKAIREASKLSPDAVKEIGTAVESIRSANSRAEKAGNLANRFSAAANSGAMGLGALSWTNEKWKSLWGTQDDITKMRDEYEALKNSEALLKLPPGSASDTDVKMALAGFPSELGNPEQVVSFLRGFQKLARYEADVNRAKYEWISANGSLATAARDFKVGNTTVKAGQTFDSIISGLAPKGPPLTSSEEARRAELRAKGAM